jgi:LemA protein
MKRSWLIIGGIVFFILIIFFWWTSTRNGLVQMDQEIKKNIGDLNAVYQRRSDLINNLVNTVKGSVQAERGTLEAVVSARASASSIQLTPEALKDPQAMANFDKAQGALQGALSRLLVTVEKYPELKSQGNFSSLMSEIEGSENRVNLARKNYNESVRDYNTKILSFPSSIVAGASGFKEYAAFQGAPGVENAPIVVFGTEPVPPATAPTQTAPAANPNSTARPSR